MAALALGYEFKQMSYVATALICALIAGAVILMRKTRMFDGLLYAFAFIFLWAASVANSVAFGAKLESLGPVTRRMAAFAMFLYLEMYTEATPPGGPWPVFHFGRDSSIDPELLAHSIYEHRSVRRASSIG